MVHQLKKKEKKVITSNKCMGGITKSVKIVQNLHNFSPKLPISVDVKMCIYTQLL